MATASSSSGSRPWPSGLSMRARVNLWRRNQGGVRGAPPTVLPRPRKTAGVPPAVPPRAAGPASGRRRASQRDPAPGHGELSLLGPEPVRRANGHRAGDRTADPRGSGEPERGHPGGRDHDRDPGRSRGRGRREAAADRTQADPPGPRVVPPGHRAHRRQGALDDRGAGAGLRGRVEAAPRGWAPLPRPQRFNR